MRSAAGLLLLCLLGAACASDAMSEPSTQAPLTPVEGSAVSTPSDATIGSPVRPSVDGTPEAAPLTPAGDFDGTDIWIDPLEGDDANDGRERRSALQTVDAAWRLIPAGTPLTTGYRLLLVAGTYPQETSVNYWEDRQGTSEAPIVVQAADGAHTAVFEGDINMFGVSHFSLIGVDIIRDGDAFHCELCDHILIRDSELDGGTGAHETVKVNQSQYVWIEDSDIHGADDNAIDFVAVQYGHVIGTKIHDAQDWCAYAKGGSAYITFADNEVYDCGTGGITAGQGTGFEFMVAPWINYEAYDIQILDNVIHDTEGAGLGVAGGYNIVFARNTLYAVGSRSHVVEFVHGRRGCDGTTDLCQANHDAGGWGSTASEEAIIPNRHVFFIDNIVLNPDGMQSQWQHLQIDGPLEVDPGSGVPSPSLADDDLRIIGNVIWNGPADHLLGTGDACAPSNESCNEDQIRADNMINTVKPHLQDPAAGDFSLTAETRDAIGPPTAIPTIDWSDAPAGVPPPEATAPS